MKKRLYSQHLTVGPFTRNDSYKVKAGQVLIDLFENQNQEISTLFSNLKNLIIALFPKILTHITVFTLQLTKKLLHIFNF